MRASVAALLSSVAMASMIATFTACAPRYGKTHFDRWADQTAKRKQEEELEKKEKEWLRAQIAGGVAAQAAPASTQRAPADTPRTTQQAPSNYNSLTGGGGTRTSTGTKSRVIRPSEQKSEEDDAVY